MEIPYQVTFHECEICEEKFSQYDDLDEHCKIHIDEEVDDHSITYTTSDNTTYTDEAVHCKIQVKKELIDYSSTLEDVTTIRTDMEEGNTTYTDEAVHCMAVMEDNTTYTDETDDTSDVDNLTVEFDPSIIAEQSYQADPSDGEGFLSAQKLSSCKRYQCSFCPKKFSRRCHLENHIRIHTGEKPFRCDVCHKHFTERRTLQKHCMIHLREIPVPCIRKLANDCKEYSEPEEDDPGNSFEENSENTQKSLSSQLKHQCHICKESFIKKCDFVKHYKSHGGKQPYKCDVCGKLFSQEKILHNHVHLYHREKAYKCGVCGCSYSHNSDLKKHMRLHTGIGISICPICEKKFISRSKLMRHMSVHVKLNPSHPLVMEFIDGTIKTEIISGGTEVDISDSGTGTFHEPGKNTTDDTIESECSDTRDTIIKSTEAMDNSRKIINNSREVIMDSKETTCDSGETIDESITDFETEIYRIDSKRSLNSETNIFNYNCNFCTKTLKNKLHLEKHLRTHTGEKKTFACDVCGGRFTIKSSLVRHQKREHSLKAKATREKAYKCGVCGCSYTHNSDLKKHMRLHLGIGISICQICEKKFTNKSKLKRHMNVHEKLNPSYPLVMQFIDGSIQTEVITGGTETDKFTESCRFDSNGFGKNATDTDEAKDRDTINKSSAAIENSGEIILNNGETVDHSLIRHENREHVLMGQAAIDDQSNDSKPSHFNFRCDICFKLFSSCYHLEDHHRSHTGEKPFKCDICCMTFMGRSSLRRHLRKNRCKRVHFASSDLDNDGGRPLKAKAAWDRAYRCGVCGCSYSHNSDLKKHMRLHTGIGISICPICEKKFINKSKLIRHMNVHEKSGPLYPLVTEYTEDTIKTEVVTGVTEIEKCVDSCTFDEADSDGFGKTATDDTDETECSDTRDTIFNSLLLGQAASDDQSNDSKHFPCSRHRCDVCFKSFKSRYHLENHYRSHTGEKPFKCDVCCVTFTERSSLLRHLRKNRCKQNQQGQLPKAKADDEPPSLKHHKFRCDVCFKSFISRYHLENHYRSHTGEKPFKCDVCRKSFTVRSSLSKHVRKNRCKLISDPSFRFLGDNTDYNASSDNIVHDNNFTGIINNGIGVEMFDNNVCGDNVTVTHNANSYKIPHDNNVSGDNVTLDNNIRRDSITLDNNVRSDNVTLDNNVSGDNVSLDNNVSGDNVTLDNNVRGDNVSLDNNIMVTNNY